MTIQRTGAFSFVNCAGLIGSRDTCSHTCKVKIPKEKGHEKWELFCYHCRSLLEDTVLEGHVLAELYDLDDMKVYKIAEGAEYQIGEYSVEIIADSDQGLSTVQVTG